MGWADAPVVEEEPSANQPSWMDAPEVQDGNSYTEQASHAGIEQTTPEPSMGAVALNAVPKGLANLANTPHTLNGLVIRGLASLPGLDKLPEVKNFLQGIADNPEFNKNHPMEFMRKIGAVNPENEPQTGPQRIVDTAIQAAVGSAAIPAGGILNTAKSAVMGATSGAAAGVTKEASREMLGPTGSDLLAGVVGMATPFAAKGIANAVTQSSKKLNVNPTEKQTLQAGQQYGLVVEPSAARGPSSLKESLAGKAALAQESSLANQPKFNEMANRYIGLPPDAPLTTKVFDSYKKTIAKPFEEVDQVFNQMKQSGQLPYFPRYHSQSLMDEYREAGDHARALWRAYSTAPTKDINMLKAAKSADAATDGVFKDIEMVAKAAGDPKLVNRLNNARKLYARVSDVQSATTVGSGNIDALAVGRMMQEGKPFEGELRDMAHFANTFPRSSRPKESIPPPGVSGGDMAMGPVIAAGTGDVKSGILAFGIPGLRSKMRRDVLSEAYQRGLLKEPSAARKSLAIPKSSARNSSIMTGKTVLDNAEGSE